MKCGLIGLGIGIAVGVVAGTLLAPKSGKEIRDDIKNKAISAKDGAAAKLRKDEKETKKVVKKTVKKASKSPKKK